jgi:carboxyl-terminal processing protease
MPPRLRRRAVGAVVLAAGAAAGLLAARQQDGRTRANAVRLEQVLSLVADRFVDSIGVDSLMTRTARGLVRELGDPYSVLYTPRELAAFDLTTRGRYGGLGILLEQQEGEHVVARVYPNSPAAASDVREGDYVVAVEAHATRGWPLAQVTDSLKGLEGTPVHVTIRRPGVAAPMERAVTRALVRVPAVPFAARLTPDVGYVPLRQFSDLSGQETRRAVQQLVASGARGVVLDLRGNLGGLVDQAVDVAGLFLPRGTPVVQVRSREAGIESVRTTAAPLVTSGVPVVVLVDGMSASASEIVAGALQDYDRALVVGTRSYGKGLVQGMYPLSGGYALKLTTSRWHTPLGRALHRARTHADSVAAGAGAVASADSAVPHALPTVKTASGRSLVADGGITPDLVVQPDTTVTAGERILNRAVGSRVELLSKVLGELTFAHSAEIRPDGVIDAAWREQLVRRLREGGVTLSPAAADTAREELDRILATRLLRRAYGDSAVARRYYGEDDALRIAVQKLEHARTSAALFGGDARKL